MSRSAYVYAIGREEGPVKIGITSALGGRLSTIQTGCPFKVDILHYCEMSTAEVAREIESDVHWVWKDRRLHGEWFDIDGDLAAEAIDGAVMTRDHFLSRDCK